MRTAGKLWMENRSFLLPFSFCIVAGFTLLTLCSRADVHLAVDAHHAPVTDFFFRLLTNLGDGWTAVVLTVILLFVRYGDAMLVAASNILSGIAVQILKHGPFAGSPRPREFFRGVHTLHFVPGVDVYSFNSFPSGHAATACACCFCLALLTRHNALKFTLAVFGLLIAFSRVYLSEHFLADAWAGALAGLAITLVTASAIYSRNEKSGWRWLDLSLLRGSGSK